MNVSKTETSEILSDSRIEGSLNSETSISYTDKTLLLWAMA